MAKAPNKPVLDPLYKQKVLRLLNERHGQSLRSERFELEARREGDEAVVKLVLRSNDNTSVYTMEAAVESSKYPALTEAQAVDITLDFLDWYVGEYLREEREALLPLDWKSMRFGDLDVMARGDLRNEFLDDAADAWLRGEHDEVQKKLAALKRH